MGVSRADGKKEESGSSRLLRASKYKSKPRGSGRDTYNRASLDNKIPDLKRSSTLWLPMPVESAKGSAPKSERYTKGERYRRSRSVEINDTVVDEHLVARSYQISSLSAAVKRTGQLELCICRVLKKDEHDLTADVCRV